MKPFDLEKALTGEPVKLRGGSKAWVKYVMPDDYKGKYPLRGIYYHAISSTKYADVIWTKDGNSFYSRPDNDLDIIGMWQEPRPRVQLDLPCPLERPIETYYYYIEGQSIFECSYCGTLSDYIFNKFELGLCFASKEDAQEWLDAMKGARK